MSIQNLAGRLSLPTLRSLDVADKAKAGAQAVGAAKRTFVAEAETGTTREALKAAVETGKLSYQSARAIAGTNGRGGDIAATLARIEALDKGPRKNVTIVGAGAAGLIAAYELERLGHSVRILEGSDRLGGRTLTHRFSDGSYHDLGGMRVPSSHDYTRHYMDVAGVESRPFGGPDGFYDIGGVRTPISEARTNLYEQFGLDPQQAVDAEKVLSTHLGELLDSLTPREKKSLFANKLASKRLEQLDKTSLADFLKSRGVDENTIALIKGMTGMNQRFGNSVNGFLRAQLGGLHEGLEEVVGGMDLIAHGLAERVKTPIEFNTKVLGMRHLDDGRVELKLSRENGEPFYETHERVLSTMPFSVTKELETPNFSPAKQAAIDNTPYDAATKVILHSKERFWEKDGLYGGHSHSDRGIGATYYPFDNASARDPKVSNGPGALLASYTWGDDARALSALSEAERKDKVVQELSRIHPEVADPKMVDEAASIAWDETNPWTRGSIRSSPVGGHELFANAIARDGNVHFAGEHASHVPGWVQGAAVSSLRAVEEIVTDPAKVAANAAKKAAE